MIKIEEKESFDYSHCENCKHLIQLKNCKCKYQCGQNNKEFNKIDYCINGFFEPNNSEQVTLEQHSKNPRQISQPTNDLSSFEFDQSKVLINKPFPIMKINDKLFGYGFMLPKYEAQRNKEGQITHIEQIRSPVVIASNAGIYPMSKKFEEEFKIKFQDIPSELDLRWDLPSLKKYLKGDYEKIDGLKLYTKIRKLYEKYLYFHNESWYSIHSLWDIGTYFFILFKAYPIFELRGVRGTAKTKIMTISNGLTFNACNEIMVNPSESSLFRETHSKRITKYIDEAEKLFQIVKGKAIADDRVTFINQSYFWKGAVARQEKIGNKYKTVYYCAFSPTMIGSINGLYGATENRAIVHITTKNPSNDNRGDLEPDTEDTIFSELRNELYIFALQNWEGILKNYNTLENDTEMRSRDFQIWKPILSIAKYLSEDLYKYIKENAEKLTKVKEETITENSVEFHLLITLGTLIYQNKYYQGAILINDIHNEYPFSDYKPSNKTIGRTLDSLGFMENRKTTNKGNGFAITKEKYDNIIINLNPSILSQLSQLSPLLDAKGSEECVEKVEKVTENSGESGACGESGAGKAQGVMNLFELIQTHNNGKGIGCLDILVLSRLPEEKAYAELQRLSKLGDIFEIKPDFWKAVQ